MRLDAWLGDDPDRIVRRSRYWRLNWWFLIVALLTLTALHLFASLVLWPGDAAAGEASGSPTGASRLLATVVLLAGGGAVSLLVTWQVVGRERQKDYHRMLRRLAEALGLAYRQHSPTNPLDRFAWAISGSLPTGDQSVAVCPSPANLPTGSPRATGGRDVKLARVPESFMGTESRFAGAVVVAVPCAAPRTFSGLIGRTWEQAGSPGQPFPQPALKKVAAWLAGQDVDLEALGRLPALEVLAMEGVVQAGIEIKGGSVRLYYELESPVLDFHPRFAERAVRATIELAEWVESKRAGLEGEATDREEAEP